MRSPGSRTTPHAFGTWSENTHSAKFILRSQAGALTVELALELGEHEGDGLGGTGGGGHNVERGCARTAKVPVRRIQEPLVAGVAVGGRHGSLHDPELLVQHLRQRTTQSVTISENQSPSQTLHLAPIQGPAS